MHLNYRGYIAVAVILVAGAPLISQAQSICPALTLGSSGSGVTALQTFFVNAYSNFPQSDVTGYFGPITQAAVEEWQSNHNIVSSGTPATTGWGVVGPRTRAAMGLSCPSANAQSPTTVPATQSSPNQSLLQTLLAELSALEAQIAGQASTTTSSQPVSAAGGGGGGAPTPIPVPPTNTSCTFNGQTVSNGQSVTAYQASTVQSGQQCVSQSRMCSNGTLSGTYQYASCSVGAAASCLFNGQTVASGASITAYQSASVPSGQTCVSQSRMCSNGNLGGSYQYSSCTVGSTASPIDVFLIAGQSNAVGYSLDPQNSPVPSAGVAYQYYNGQITATKDPVGAGTGSAWPSFAIAYNKGTGHVVGFVPTAVAGTGQSAKADGGSGNWDTSGALFNNSVATLNAAMQAFKNAGYTPTFRGVLWDQGENDGGYINLGSETSNDYLNALDTMIGRYQAAYGTSMPFYIFQTGTWVGQPDAGYAAVRNAQAQAPSLVPNTHVVFTDAINFPAKGYMQTTGGAIGVHYTQAGYNEMGTTGGQNVAALIGGVAQKPSIASFTASPNSISAGQSSTLSWSASNAISLSINGIGTVTGTSVQVTPSQTTTYTLTATNSQGSVTAAATISVTLSPGKPLIGAFRWDGWFPTNVTVFPQFFPSNFYTAWSYREPTYGWFDEDTSGAQAIMDQEILDAANHGLDFWVFDDYKYTQTWPQDGSQTPLYDAYKEYLASPNKSHLKFALWISPGVTSGGGIVQNYWRSTYLPYLIQTFQDPQYLKVDGNRPVLFVESGGSSPSYIDLNFGAAAWPQEHAYLNQQAEAAGLGDPVIIQTDADIAAAKADGLDGVSTYGVEGNGATPSSGCAAEPGDPTPICPFSSQVAKDESNWATEAQSGLTVVPGLTPVDDSRGLTSPYGFYVDQPTYTQWQQEVKDAFTFMTGHQSIETNPPIAVIYAWNELSEGGPGIIPTKQNGTMFLDAINAVKTGNYPSTYTDTYNGDNTLISRTGNWVDYTPVPGNFNNDEEISEAYGDTATLSADNATAFKVVGTEGPTDGVMQVYIDGVSQGAISRTQANWSQDAVVFQSAALPAGTHTLKIVNISSGANVYVGIDYIVVSHGAVSTPATPTVSFTGNGQGSLTVNVGDSVTFQWNVTNAVSASGTYTADGGAPQPWTGHPNTLSGSQTDVTGAAEAGHTYVVTYTGTNAQGQSAFANILVKVNP